MSDEADLSREILLGDETSVLGYASADWPASSPWVTAVGGTSPAVGEGTA